ncbi:MAG: long-chain fatty acid--CoA ligase [Gemmatimonadetes bacterium]|nr:long-chain fatty acid--CoA ligase [Gemmatimonadota bacterium]
MESSGLPLFERAERHGDRVATVASGRAYSYRDLLDASAAIACRLLDGADDLNEARVAFLVPPAFDYVATQWGIWRAGGIAVPLGVSHPGPELEHAIVDADASVVVAHPSLSERVAGIAEARGARLLITQEDRPSGEELVARPSAPRLPLPNLKLPRPQLPRLSPDRRAMILFTSGTTSRPKGVVSTHGNIQAQVETLVAAWAWSQEDHVLLVLPLHHIHGVINVLSCALWSGARCTIYPTFNAETVWGELVGGDLTLFMAVPTVYSRLIAAWEAADPKQQRETSEGCRRLRLMVSGSAALPVRVLERWRDISGHTLLERYGMTEIGMALSNPLEGERRPGHVGLPLPGVEVRLVDDEGVVVPRGIPGEIEVRGPSVFREYWRRPEVTRDSFRDGWFRTGDVAVVEDGYHRVLGRSSVDILKTGGYKVSALEIEEVLRTHPAIEECAVVGKEDEEWGERVCGALVLRPGASLSREELRSWAAERLAPYKVPSEVLMVVDLPRNAMGKVTKSEVKKLF